MTKQIPYWGRSAQPASTYYKMKLNVDICCIVDHCTGQAHIFLFDERLGPKCADHTLSLLTRHINTKVPDWAGDVQVFMDNAAINKNKYLSGWLQEMTSRFNSCRASFMLPGHTKFIPDWVFAGIAHTYRVSDVFTMPELLDIAGMYGNANILSGADDISEWRDVITAKYSDLPGIQQLHDIRACRQPNSVRCEVRTLCWDGDWQQSPQIVIDPSADGVPVAYRQLHIISTAKRQHLITMYNRWIPEDRRLPFLPDRPV
ncbi:uncharacterized protein [Ptychodera flava]|uniref:uncharacterized protein n=3 Tax=Ptychodera flava TaxID=63121 RepID=UPI00396A56E1